MKEFICLTVFLVLSVLFAAAMIAAGFICQYGKKCPIKESPYECGLEPMGDTAVKFDIKYFNYAVLFLIFDIETVFLYPYAVFADRLGIFALIEAFIFLSLLLFGLFFAVNKKLLRRL